MSVEIEIVISYTPSAQFVSSNLDVLMHRYHSRVRFKVEIVSMIRPHQLETETRTFARSGNPTLCVIIAVYSNAPISIGHGLRLYS